MRKTIKNRGKLIALLITVTVGLILIFSSVAMLIRYKNEISDRSSETAKYYTLTARNELEKNLEKYTVKAAEIAFTVTDEIDNVSVYLDGFVSDDSIKFSRYFDKEGNFYDKDGSLYTGSKDPSIEYVKTKADKCGYVGTFDDDLCVDQGTMSVIGFYAPVSRSDKVSGIVNYYTRQNLVELFKNQYKSEKAEFSVVCTDEGKIVSGLDAEVNSQLFTYLYDKFGTKYAADEIKEYLQKGESGIVAAGFGGQRISYFRRRG